MLRPSHILRVPALFFRVRSSDRRTAALLRVQLGEMLGGELVQIGRLGAQYGHREVLQHGRQSGRNFETHPALFDCCRRLRSVQQ